MIIILSVLVCYQIITGIIMLLSQALGKFYDTLMQAILRHIRFDSKR